VDKPLPHTATLKDQGSLEPFMRIILAMLGILDLLQGCVQLVAPDSGAGSIAGMNLSTSSAPTSSICWLPPVSARLPGESFTCISLFASAVFCMPYSFSRH
jgi:hypothetical protein